MGGDTVISKSVRGLRPPEAGALLAAAVARLQARAACLRSACAVCSSLLLASCAPCTGRHKAILLVLWACLAR